MRTHNKKSGEGITGFEISHAESDASLTQDLGLGSLGTMRPIFISGTLILLPDLSTLTVAFVVTALMFKRGEVKFSPD